MDFLQNVGQSYLDRKAYGAPQQLENLATKQFTSANNPAQQQTGGASRKANLNGEATTTKASKNYPTAATATAKDQEIANLKRELAQSKKGRENTAEKTTAGNSTPRRTQPPQERAATRPSGKSTSTSTSRGKKEIQVSRGALVASKPHRPNTRTQQQRRRTRTGPDATSSNRNNTRRASSAYSSSSSSSSNQSAQPPHQFSSTRAPPPRPRPRGHRPLSSATIDTPAPSTPPLRTLSSPHRRRRPRSIHTAPDPAHLPHRARSTRREDTVDVQEAESVPFRPRRQEAGRRRERGREVGVVEVVVEGDDRWGGGGGIRDGEGGRRGGGGRGRGSSAEYDDDDDDGGGGDGRGGRERRGGVVEVFDSRSGRSKGGAGAGGGRTVYRVVSDE